MIREDFLHYLWKHKLFDFLNLLSCNEEIIEVISVGELNINSGPDFFNSKMRINEQLWAGNVEIHIKSSDWYVHNHENDSAYDNVILHVVWEHDIQIFRKDNSEIATLEIKKYVNQDLLESYQKLFSKRQAWINCENRIAKTAPFVLNNWLEKLYIDRLSDKSTEVLILLKKSKNDWELVLFKLLTKNFGLKVNGQSFFNLATSFDFSILRKNQTKPIQLEALLFGQASLLNDDIEDAYFQILKKEYAFLQVKYGLTPINSSEIQFFRLRPNNFPTIRLAQLSKLYTSNQNLFSKVISINKLTAYYELFQNNTSEFWDTHYSFKSTSSKRKKHLTKSFIDLLLINTIIPLKFVYLKHTGKYEDELVLSLIQELKPEKNSVINKFTALKVKAINALESQALLHLKKNYCSKQLCLQCAIGNAILKS